MNSHTIRVRFAPSPTGHLHIGGLRTALFNWLFAKHTGGAYLLRIEDTDVERSKDSYLASIMESFRWCGLLPDEPVVIQSNNISRHHAVAQELVNQGKAYRCYCTQEMVAQRQREQFGSPFEYGRYDGYCRHRSQEYGRPYSIRFAIPADCQALSFDDLVRGQVTIEASLLDDFILLRSDGMPTYNFAVVVDDADMGITHVLRGEDHIPNTPKQMLIYQACNFLMPRFGHLSMILGPSGQRLSKRDGATSVVEYKEAGFLPDALLNYLARLGWSHGDQEIFTKDEMVALFSLDHVGKKSAIFDIEKLLWVNSVHLRAMPAQEIAIHLAQIPPGNQNSIWSTQQLIALITLYKERVKTVKELAQELTLLAHGPDHLSDDASVWLTPQSIEYLRDLLENLATLTSFEVDLITAVAKHVCQRYAIKLVQLAQPIRLALVGKTTSPGVFELMAILGSAETTKRLTQCIRRLEGTTK